MEKLDFTITLVRNNRKRRKKLRTKQKSNVILLSTTRIIYVIDNTTPVLCYSNLKFVYTKDFFSNHQINLTRIKKENQLEIEPKATAVSEIQNSETSVINVSHELVSFRFNGACEETVLSPSKTFTAAMTSALRFSAAQEFFTRHDLKLGNEN